ncbi:MAG: WD40 repeat domain-containing protein, partial [Brachybacterium sp.]|nr:WD40 repeat domain-containing protein [Brachybacterium sp.]
MQKMRTIINRPLVGMGIALLTLTACGGSAAPRDGAADPDPDATEETAAEDTVERREVGALTPRIVLAHDGGVTTLSSADGEVLGESDVEGYTRLNPSGDGRHVFISAADAFTAYDTGLIAEEHGDHHHYYEQTPQLTDIAVDAPKPGHVVPHADRTSLFADGTGAITTLDPANLADGELGETAETATDDPHHGVAVPLSGGGMLLTQGTEDERSTVQVRDADGTVVAETDDCPGIHGEAVAEPTERGDVVSVGCENGPVIYRDGAFHAVDVPEEYQRSGNQKGHPSSPVVLADYKVEEEPAGGIARPTRIGLIDTRSDEITPVELGSAYWFRSLDRGPNGEALVLTYDGNLQVIDPESGEITRTVPVVQEWEEKHDWQQPGPMMAVADGTAFVVDPEAKTLSMVDVRSGDIYRELDLPVVPHEIQVTTGTPSGEIEVGAGDAHAEEDDHGDHDHDDHD